MSDYSLTSASDTSVASDLSTYCSVADDLVTKDSRVDFPSTALASADEHSVSSTTPVSLLYLVLIRVN